MKKNVKHELKDYDFGFYTFFKRSPEKREKEMMRPLYIYYKSIKNKIHYIEQKKKGVTLKENNYF